VADYKTLASKFNQVQFSAANIVVSQVAGMKYIVITSKHHDGCRIRLKAINYYRQATPFKRDPLKGWRRVP
jgi:alpha-L-fucosidase